MYSKGAFKAKPNQNQNVKPMLKKDSCNNAVFKSMKTLIKRKARFTMDKSGNESKKYRQSRGNEARYKLYEAPRKEQK